MKPSHALDQSNGKFQPKRTVFTEQTFAVGIEDVGLMLDALDGTTLTKMSLPTAKGVRQEHRILLPAVYSMRYAFSVKLSMVYR